MNRSYSKLSLIFLILISTGVTIVFAPSNIFITDTPLTLGGTYTECTLDIEPKYRTIKREPLNWDISMRVDVLGSGKVTRIEFLIFLEDDYLVLPNDLNDGLVHARAPIVRRPH